MDGNEGNIETIVNISRPELNVACVGEAGLSPLHYAVKKKLRRGLATMVQHSSFTLGVTDKVRHIGVFVHVSVCCLLVFTSACRVRVSLRHSSVLNVPVLDLWILCQCILIAYLNQKCLMVLNSTCTVCAISYVYIPRIVLPL